MRVAGVSVGKVRDKALDPKHPNRTVATIELTRKYAPIASDARAILRQKTLLGETYVELTPGEQAPGGHRARRRLPGRRARGQDRRARRDLPGARPQDARELPARWQQDLSKAVAGRGRDLNDALGNLPAFADDANDLLTVLDGQVAGRSAGSCAAPARSSARSRRTRASCTTSSSTPATPSTPPRASRRRWPQTFRIFPTFLDESKATFQRLERFSKDTDPLVQDLRPAAARPDADAARRARAWRPTCATSSSTSTR